MAIEIRRAREDDSDWLTLQLKEFSQFFGSKQPLFGNEQYVRAALAAMIGGHLVLVAECPKSGLVGFVGGYVTPHPFNPEIRCLSETFWWVDAAHRGSMLGGQAATLLVDEFVAWGKENVDWITFSREAHSPISERVFTRRGFRLQEQNFLLEVS